MKNKKVYVIDFYYKKNDSLSKGTIYIDTASYAFVALKLTAYNIRRGFPFIPVKTANAYITYKQTNGKWYVENITYSNYAIHSGAGLQRTTDFNYVSIDTTNVLPFGYANTIQELDEDIKINKTGSDSSWLAYASAFASAEKDSLINSTPAPIIDTTVKKSVHGTATRVLQSIVRYLRSDNCRFLLSITKLPGAISQPGSTIKGASMYSIGFGAQYRVYKQLFVQAEGDANFGLGGLTIKQSCYYLTNSFILNKHHRPFIIAPFTGYNRVLATDVNKTKKEIFYNIAGGVTAGLEISHRACFYLSGTYNKLLSQTNPGAFAIKPTKASGCFGVAFKL